MKDKIKKIVIICYNDYSLSIIDKLIESDKYFVVSILDNLTNKKKYRGIPINKIINIKSIIFDEIYILDDLPYNDEIYNELYDLDIDKINIIVKESIEEIFVKKIFNVNVVQTYYLKRKAILKYLEAHINDKCNMNCNGCTHFSNITLTNDCSLEQFERDFKRLSKMFNIPVIRLMGGEPFLNEDIIKYLKVSRKYFQLSTIFIVTNGLLINSLRDELLKEIRELNIVVNITLYEPTIRLLEKIEDKLKNNNIVHYYGRGNSKPLESDYIKVFHTCLTLNPNNKDSYKYCYNRYCFFLRNGLLSKCAYPSLVNNLNYKFNTKYIINEEDFINIYSKKLSPWQIVNKLSNKMNFCSYCKKETRSYKWNNKKAELTYYLTK